MLAHNSPIDDDGLHSEAFPIMHNIESNSMLPVCERSQLNRAKIALQEKSGEISAYEMRSKEKFNKLII